MLTEQIYTSFKDEMGKLAAGKDIGQLLSGLATRTGARPSMIPSIQQAKNVALKDRGRAAEIAQNVRSALKTKQLVAA
jgi:hypothetical protein